VAYLGIFNNEGSNFMSFKARGKDVAIIKMIEDNKYPRHRKTVSNA